MRFNDTMKTIFRILEKQEREKGRIKIYDSYIELTDDPRPVGKYPIVENPISLGDYDRITLDQNGRKGKNRKGKAVICNNEDKMINYYVINTRNPKLHGLTYIPYSDCKKCQSHITRKQNNKRWPECEYKLRK